MFGVYVLNFVILEELPAYVYMAKLKLHSSHIDYSIKYQIYCIYQ